MNSARNTCCTPEKTPLSSVPKVAIVERFDCNKKREGLPPNTPHPHPPPRPPYPEFFRVISGPGKFE